MKGLFIYPNFSYTNPNQKQFERLLSGLVDKCEIHILSRRGPRLQLTPGTIHYIQEESRIKSRFQHALQRVCPVLAYCPDELRILINSSLKKTGMRLVEMDDFDFIATLSFPLSDQLVGYHISKKHDIPWIAMFYDPWTDNPYRNKKGGIAKRIDAYYEKMVATNADAIIHTNNYIASIWERRYGIPIKDKIHTLPFCYSKSMMAGIESRGKKRETIILSYVGSRFKQRNLQDVILAVKQLKDEGFKDIERLRIRIYGNKFDPDDTLIDDNGLSSIFEWHGVVPEESLSKIYMDSDLFIVIDSPGKMNIFFPSKLMDYFYFQKPIIGITPLNGVTSDYLNASGNIAISNGDIESIKEILKVICVQGPEFINNDKGFWKSFNPEKIGADFLKIAESVRKHY